jgi:hypothetical protein
MSTARVHVLEGGVYLLPSRRAGPYAEAGTLIEVPEGPYADELVELGYLMYAPEVVAVTPVSVVPATTVEEPVQVRNPSKRGRKPKAEDV